MENITEDYIEKFVRFPEALSDQERARIRKAISNSKQLQELAEWFRQFYVVLDEEIDREGKTISLEVSDFGQKATQSERNLLLAAKTETEDFGNSSLKTITTLVSESESTLVRVLKDESSDEYRFHLLMESNPKPNDLYILHLRQANIDVVIDQSRHISLPMSKKLDSVEWNKEKVSLKTPVDFIGIPEQIIELLKNGNFLAKSGVSISFTGEARDWVLKVEKQNVCSFDIRLLVLQTDQDQYEIYRFADKEFLQLNYQNQETFKLWLFN